MLLLSRVRSMFFIFPPGVTIKTSQTAKSRTRGAVTHVPDFRVDSSAIGCCEEMMGCLLATGSARGDEVQKAQTSTGWLASSTSLGNHNGACGAAGAPNQTEMQAIVLEEVLNPAERAQDLLRV